MVYLSTAKSGTSDQYYNLDFQAESETWILPFYILYKHTDP